MLLMAVTEPSYATSGREERGSASTSARDESGGRLE